MTLCGPALAIAGQLPAAVVTSVVEKLIVHFFWAAVAFMVLLIAYTARH